MSERRREIVLPESELKKELRRRTRRDFLIAGIAGAAALGGYKWVTSAKREDGTPWPQRRVLDLNRKLATAYLSNSHLMPAYSRDQVGWLKPNGNIGLEDPVDVANWHLTVQTGQPRTAPLDLRLSDVMAIPKTEMITRFCCIEGWSTIVHWGGVRFSDFTNKYFPPGAKLPQFVSLTTPDQDYYVGLDMKSAMHPQTLLAYERNGRPLEPEHGAPLRLVIPVKYGIKSIKRIGSIQYTDSMPSDYWAEEGYDWFAGL